jgi:hypothetical protein
MLLPPVGPGPGHETEHQGHCFAGSGHRTYRERGGPEGAQERARDCSHAFVDHVGGQADQSESYYGPPRRPGPSIVLRGICWFAHSPHSVRLPLRLV